MTLSQMFLDFCGPWQISDILRDVLRLGVVPCFPRGEAGVRVSGREPAEAACPAAGDVTLRHLAAGQRSSGFCL